MILIDLNVTSSSMIIISKKEKDLFYSIGEFSKRVNLTPRGLRYYESIGLIDRLKRKSNGYRYYSQNHEDKIKRINYLKSLGFSLDEIKEYLIVEKNVDVGILKKNLKVKIVKLKNESLKINRSIDEISNLLSALQKIDKKEPLTLNERRLVMENLKEDVLCKLKENNTVNHRHLDFLEREAKLIDSEEKKEFVLAVKKCVSFAKKRKLKIGPGRGSANASIFLFAFEYSKVDPTKEELFPEYYLSGSPEIWFDVQYDGGDEFVQYCKEVSKGLSYGEIEAFKFPLLDIIDDTFKMIGKEIDFSKVDNNSKEVLSPFRNADIERVFLFDAPANSLIYNVSDMLRLSWLGPDLPNQYLKRQTIFNFRDVMNISSLLHRSHSQAEERLNDYISRKEDYREYLFLPAVIREKLKSNFGMILYFEEVIDILKTIFGWNVLRGRKFLIELRKKEKMPDGSVEFNNMGQLELLELLKKEAKFLFNKSHLWGEMLFTKQTAYLKTKHKKEYYRAIDDWESENGLSWSEIGYKAKGITLMQN